MNGWQLGLFMLVQVQMVAYSMMGELEMGMTWFAVAVLMAYDAMRTRL